MKKIICVLLSLLSVIAAVGCQAGDSADVGESTFDATETVSIPSETTDAPQETSSVPQETTDAPQEDPTEETTSTVETTETEPAEIDTGFPNEAESEGTKRY